MRTIIAMLVLASSLAPGAVQADDHVASAVDVTNRLAASAAARQEQLAALDQVLATPAAQAAAVRLGADAARLRARVAALDEPEARDLAARAYALGLDPAAGHDWDTNDVLVVFLVFAIVILVLHAV